jgi:glycosyltransferase involved in cell wall biosynthesis
LSISVIIPCFNEYDNLLKLKDFFLNIDGELPTEIIIADSPISSDASERIGPPFLYLKTKKSGRAHQMNEGARIAKGDVLVFLHADVLPPINFGNEIQESIDHGFHFGFFAYRFRPTSFMLNINASFTGQKGIFSGGGDQIHFMHKSLYDSLNGYDEKFQIMEDFDFVAKVKKSKTPYTIVHSKAIVSSRKYRNNSWLRVNIVNLVAFLMFKLNIDSGLIKKVYYQLLR